jgi:hypothetical protein
MTGLFLHLNDHFAVLAMDSLTVTYSEGRRVQHGWAAKFIPLPQLDAILAVTGYMPALLHSASCLSELALSSDFDSSAEALEEFLKTHHDHCTFPEAAGHPKEHSSTRVYLIGHSIKETRFVAHRYDSASSFDRATIYNACLCSPPNETAIQNYIEKWNALGYQTLDFSAVTEIQALMESAIRQLHAGADSKDGTPSNIGGAIAVAFLYKMNCIIRTMGSC